MPGSARASVAGSSAAHSASGFEHNAMMVRTEKIHHLI